MKAIEAAARAVYDQRPHQYWDHSEQARGWVYSDYSEVDEGWRELATEQARAAIRAYLTALAEDDAAVERVARAMLADELTVRPTLAFDPAWQQECDIWLSNARAAIRAMGGE